MKNFVYKIVPAFLLVIFFTSTSFSGCKSNTPSATEADVSINFNETKEISIAETSINITFTEVIESRCSLEDCYLCYGSRANIKIVLSGSTIPLQVLGCNTDNQGNILDDREYIDTLGYRINAYRLEPYPIDNIPINQSDYSLKIKISKL